MIPIRSWEYQLGAEVLRANLRYRQSKPNGIPPIGLVDDIITGITWRVCEYIGIKLGGEKLPR